MKSSRFSEERQAGLGGKELCRKHGISDDVLQVAFEVWGARRCLAPGG